LSEPQRIQKISAIKKPRPQPSFAVIAPSIITRISDWVPLGRRRESRRVVPDVAATMPDRAEQFRNGVRRES